MFIESHDSLTAKVWLAYHLMLSVSPLDFQEHACPNIPGVSKKVHKVNRAYLEIENDKLEFQVGNFGRQTWGLPLNSENQTLSKSY